MCMRIPRLAACIYANVAKMHCPNASPMLCFLCGFPSFPTELPFDFIGGKHFLCDEISVLLGKWSKMRTLFDKIIQLEMFLI